MNNSPEVNWLALLAPSIVAGIIVIVGQVIFAFWLSKKIQGHKQELDLALSLHQNDLNQNLEEYKARLNQDLQAHVASLQAANQVAQTKFSTFHNRRADAVERLYELASSVETSIQEWLVFDSLSKTHSKQEHLTMLKSQEDALTKFFDHKRIYWDQPLIDSFFDFYRIASALIPVKTSVSTSSSNLDSLENTQAVAVMNFSARELGRNCVSLLHA